MIALLRMFALAAGLLLAAALPACAQGYSAQAKQVIAAARTATGGAGWAYLRGWHETGTLGGAPYESWLDTLRYGMRLEVREPAGRRIHGFNGFGDWQIQADGGATGVDDPAAVALARTIAFLNVEGYLWPSRFDARGAYVGVRQAKGRSFDVLTVQPWHGEPRDLWFDRKTHLLARIVDHTGASPVVTEVSDYRRVGPVQVPFRFASDDPARDRTVETLSFVPPDRALFSLPRPPEPPHAAATLPAVPPPPPAPPHTHRRTTRR